eukprot:Seg4603.2 transcript_id=Seg4603.2/GoldUCD/mRNA.D3Y31 product="RING finger protein 141" protein_id=Seg4603.2/GoldUCD/D3Y31
MGKVQSHVTNTFHQVFTEERKLELKRGLSSFSERAVIFKEVALLKRTDLNDAVKDLNHILENSCKASQFRVLFHTKDDGGLDWKASARIFCFQIDKGRDDPVLTRYMNIIQFWKLRCEIFRQIHKKELQDELGEFAVVNMDGEVVNKTEASPLPVMGSAENPMTTSAIVERVDALSSEEVECCICMECKSDVSLACAHCFCKQCIDSWYTSQHDVHKTCPMCREIIKPEDEFWEMADAPDKDEMRSYIVSLASGI